MDVGDMREPEHDGSSSRAPDEGKSGLLLRFAGSALGTRARQLFSILTNAKTLGVRVAAFDGQGAVFLVRHTYVAGWHLPGGQVDAGETGVEAAARELREEGNLELLETPQLRGIHFNPGQLSRDHVLFFLCPRARQTSPRPPDREIAASGFFSLDALPADTSSSTHRRLAELRGEPADPYW